MRKFIERIGKNNNLLIKGLISVLILKLNEKQSLFKTEILESFEIISKNSEVDEIITVFFTSLNSESSELKIEVLKWILNNKASLEYLLIYII